MVGWNRFSMGWLVTDLNRPDMGLGEESRLPLGWKLGFGYSLRSSVIDIDIHERAKDRSIALGGERWFLRKTLALRRGLGFGTREFRDINLGAGYRIGRIQFDYAFTLPLTGIQQTVGNHRLGISVDMGKKSKEATTEDVMDLDPKDLEPLRFIEQAKQKMREKGNIKQKMKNHYGLGLDYYKKGEYERAIEEFRKILNYDPKHPQSLQIIRKSKERLQRR